MAYVYLNYADRHAQTIENTIASFTKQISLWKKSSYADTHQKSNNTKRAEILVSANISVHLPVADITRARVI
jgi:hypothetical protein